MNNPPVSVVFPADGNLHRLEIRLQAIQLSPYHAGPPDTPSQTTGPGRRIFWHALVPFTFRIQVSHSTQEPVGPEKAVRSCDLHVLVHEPAEPVASEGMDGRARGRGSAA